VNNTPGLETKMREFNISRQNEAMQVSHEKESKATPDSSEGGERKLLSVVVPFYNEEDVVEEFHNRLSAVLAGLPLDAEVIYVNDGSTDAGVDKLLELRKEDQTVAIVDLSRNFGKEIAMTAGLDAAGGDAVVIIDADLQDPPELINEFVRLWQDGYDNVYAQRTERRGETWLKKATARAFYRGMTLFGETTLPTDVGDFRLLSRRAVEALKVLRERHRFMKGLFAWIGFPSIAVPYQRDPRFAGTTKWNYWKLCNLAVEGFTSYSTMPLRLAGLVGTLLAILAFGFGFFIVLKKLLYGDAVAGYPSLIVLVSLLGGIQLVSLGILGEYLARVFNETKSRPLYFFKAFHPCQHSNQSGYERAAKG